MATKKTPAKKTTSKLPVAKMTKAALIRYMADQREVPPKQIASFFTLLIETVTTPGSKASSQFQAWASS